MRLFIAIGLPEDWKKTLALPEASIGWLGRGVKWVEPRGMHLTLRFLGEVEDHELPSIIEAVDRICRRVPAFSMRIHGTGVFPNPKRPRVYWAGVDAPKSLITMQQEIEDAMQDLDFEPESQAFKPHLTLARIKEPIGKDRMTEALLSFRLDCDPITVSEVLLMRSHLSADGARYEAIHRFSLSQSPSSE
jgi:2'-5' RNA ligase